jgi:Uncharacterized protein conserved in bacteria (DUF2171)
MPDPVSWLMIEKGWKVVGADGRQLGIVDEVIGDTTVDIFNGLSVSHGLLGRPRYVPADKVRDIFEGLVELDLDRDRFERLGEYDQPPPSEEIRADTTDL